MIKKFSTVLGRGGLTFAMSQGTTFKDRKQAIAYANERIKNLRDHQQTVLDKEQKKLEEMIAKGKPEEIVQRFRRPVEYAQYIIGRYECAIIKNLTYDPSQAIHDGLEKELAYEDRCDEEADRLGY